MIKGTLTIRAVLVALALALTGCKSDSESVQTLGITTAQPETVLLTQVAITDYIVVSTRRVGRTVMEYTLRGIATNSSATRYTNVTANLTSVPAHINIVEGNLVFGTVVGSDDTTSADDFVIEVDLSIKTAIDELVWRVEGTVPGTGGGGDGTPEQTGIFMSIDENRIKGESTSGSHAQWIELLSFNEGSSIDIGSGISGGDRASLKLNLDGVTVTKLLDISSPLLRLAVAEGDIFTEVKIDVIKACGGTLFTEYALTLTVASITALATGGSSADERPTETLSFNYSRIETMYTPVGPGCRPGRPIFSFQDAIKL